MNELFEEYAETIQFSEKDFDALNFIVEAPDWLKLFKWKAGRIIKSYAELSITFVIDLFGSIYIHSYASDTTVVYQLDFNSNEILLDAEVCAQGKYLILIFRNKMVKLYSFPSIGVILKETLYFSK